MNRRQWLRSLAGGSSLVAFGHASGAQSRTAGAIVGEPAAARVGREILEQNGNAVDAVVAGAFAACVASPHNCGIGGYGGHMVVASAGTGKVHAVDFNTAAPAILPGNRGIPRHGWAAVGVPGVLAGLELGLGRFGTWSLRQVLEPAIVLAGQGIPVSRGLAAALRNSASGLLRDPALAALFFQNNHSLREGDPLRNADLAGVLRQFHRENSVRSFYEGELARKIAAQSERNGGFLRASDLKSYRARTVAPSALDWNGSTIWTAPLTAGGFTVLQALKILQQLGWNLMIDESECVLARIEALRWAWRDRLAFLGDPDRVDVPADLLLSDGYTRLAAERIGAAIRSRRPIPETAPERAENGTVHLSAADAAGNLAALTLTHGDAFGAQVTVERTGIVLGHGLSRFDPRANHPNSVEPGKRPLHNMCPTIVTRGNRPTLALGGAGGRLIPSAIFNVLLPIIAAGASPEEAIRAPRVHTQGNLELILTRNWPDQARQVLEQSGYRVRSGGSALVSAVAIGPADVPPRALSQ